MIPVVWLSHHPDVIARGYWDQGMLEAILDGRLWRSPYAYDHRTTIPGDGGAVVVVPARHHAGEVALINAEIAHLAWVIVVLTGDEEHVFPAADLWHPNMRVWQMTPDPARVADGVRYFGTGWPPAAAEILPSAIGEAISKPLAWFFSGQVTHARREQCVAQLRLRSDGELHETEGFTQGLPPHTYYHRLASAKVAPAPSGPESVDSFRLFEALEAGCVPIADGATPRRNERAFWYTLFGTEPPFPVIDSWSSLPGYMADVLGGWPRNAAEVSAWWQRQKRDMALRFHDDVAELSGAPAEDALDGLVTVLVPTSPIESHPDTTITAETIATIRHHFPEAEIILMADGVRSEQVDLADRYAEYLRRLLWLCNHEWRNVTPMVFDEHRHQASMARAAIDAVRTPVVCYVEHDAPIVTDEPIEWDELIEAVTSGVADVVRLHHEASVLPDHVHLMLDEEPRFPTGAPMLRTIQWSQRPHLASTAYYRHILDAHFSKDARTMIEDVMHSVVQTAHNVDGETGWHRHRLWMYAPPGNMKRSYHLDGRGSASKFDMVNNGRRL